jgi:1,4-dihydroxy-2-naphthoyl-CoA hydrolase
VSTPDAAAAINEMHRGTWAERVGLRVLTATRDGVTAEVELRDDHRQPIGAALDAMSKGKTVVGLDNHTSFVRAVRSGKLVATGTPVTRGRRSQLWDVVLRDESGATIASGRVRLMVLDPDADVAGAPIGGGAAE